MSSYSVAAWCRLRLTECYCRRKLNQKNAEWCQNVFVKVSYWRTWVTKLSVDRETAQACGSRPIREKYAFRGLKETEHSDRGWIVVLQQWREWENQYNFQTLKQSDIFLLQPNKLPNMNLLINIILDFNVYLIVTTCRKMSDLLNKWFNQNVNTSLHLHRSWIALQFLLRASCSEHQTTKEYSFHKKVLYTGHESP